MTKKYQCAIYGREYNPQKGEPLPNIPPGGDFSALADGWKTTVCGAAKRFFNRSCD
ncbi:MAG: rubredoxin [Methanomicrobiales archaeon]